MRGSPAPPGREGLKEIVRGRDEGRTEVKRQRREKHRRRKDLRNRCALFLF